MTNPMSEPIDEPRAESPRAQPWGCHADCKAEVQGWPAPCFMYPDDAPQSGCALRISPEQVEALRGELASVQRALTASQSDLREAKIRLLTVAERLAARTAERDALETALRTIQPDLQRLASPTRLVPRTELDIPARRDLAGELNRIACSALTARAEAPAATPTEN